MSLTLIVITGPTGVGKTELTLRVAEHYQVPVINADSRQIYREIPIGTAAPTREQQARVRHYFVGSRSVSDDYSASMYEQDVLRLLADMEAQGQEVALLSGGSMLYVDAVCKGIDDIPTVRDDIRSLLKQRLATIEMAIRNHPQRLFGETVGKHLFRPLVDALIEQGAIHVEPYLDHPERARPASLGEERGVRSPGLDADL